jgi:hypothetical protein
MFVVCAKVAFCLILLAAPLRAAQPRVVISEFMAENNGFLRDSFNNASDWLELQNLTGSPVSLDGWSLSDNSSQPAKWVLPAVVLPPWGTRLVWASGANLREPDGELHTSFALSKNGEFLGLFDPDRVLVHGYAPVFPAQYENVSYGLAITVATNSEALVSNGSPARAWSPSDDALGAAWRLPDFPDAEWASGALPAGFGTKNPSWLAEVSFNLQPFALGKPGVFLRAPFVLEDAGAVQALSLAATYDDGAALFLNGAPACSFNAPPYEGLSWSSYAASILTDPASQPDSSLGALTHALVSGANVLAVHLLNCNATSSDLFFKATLTATLKRMSATNPPSFLTAPTPGALNGGELTQRLPQRVTFSRPSGILTGPFTLTLAGSLPGQTIRYTADGADPSTTNSSLYGAPLVVSGSVHVRARVFDALGRSGETASATYTFAAGDDTTRAFATALPTRSTGNPSTSNQYAVAAAHASVAYPRPCHGTPIQKPRCSSRPAFRLTTPISRPGACFVRMVQYQASPRATAGSATSRRNASAPSGGYGHGTTVAMYRTISHLGNSAWTCAASESSSGRSTRRRVSSVGTAIHPS